MAGQLSGDTITDGQGATMADAPVPMGDGDRPQPTDPPGAGGAAGWSKLAAPAASGWNRIDDVGDDGMAKWRQT
jgi:hypothetical protein